MANCKLTNAQARRFLLRKHGLIGEQRFTGKDGVLEFVRQAGCIQFDPIDVCGKNPELVLQSRVKGFTKSMLYELLYEDRRLVDYFDKNLSIFPVEDWKYFARRRDSFRQQTRSQGKVIQISDEIKDFIRKSGYAASKDIDFSESVDWYWSATTLSRAALETLYFIGELAIHHKQGAIKHYALVEDCIPAEILNEEDPNQTEAEYHAWHVLRRIGALGLLWNRPSDAWLGVMNLKAAQRKDAFGRLLSEGKIAEIEVDGIKDGLYCQTGDLPLVEQVMQERELAPRTEFIAPLDNFMWDRKLIGALFGFDYRWEIYTPVDHRKFGYYVLPVLSGERFAGRAEIIADKKAAKLVVKNIWLEDGVKKGDVKKDIRQCIKRFAAFHDCGSIEYTISF